MKHILFLILLTSVATSTASNRAANTIILDAQGVENLGIAFATVEETDFEQSIFAIGRIEEMPDRHAVLSSRVPGRIAGILVQVGQMVEAGQDLVKIESRQAGDPPPTITLRAPISGMVTESHMRVGEPVDPDKEMLDIQDLAEVWAVARVPEHQIPQLTPGKTVARIRVPALGADALTGTLLRLGTVADRESGSIDAIFRVPNADFRLRPGMRAEFSIVTEKRVGVMAVPRQAIQGDPAGRVVYVKDFDIPNAFVRTPVQIGARNEEMVEITRGLFPGDEVVTTGSYLLGFAGGGGVSLKEALDAAHGHAHNEDGSEITADQRKASGHEDDSPPARDGLTLFLGGTSAVLLVALIFALVWKRKGAAC